MPRVVGCPPGGKLTQWQAGRAGLQVPRGSPVAGGAGSTVVHLQAGGAGGIGQLGGLGLGREVQGLGGLLRETQRSEAKTPKETPTEGQRGHMVTASKTGIPGTDKEMTGTSEQERGTPPPWQPSHPRPGAGVPAGGGGQPWPRASSPRGQAGCAAAAGGTPLWKRRQGEKSWMSTEQQTACLTRSRSTKGTEAYSWPSSLPAKALPGPRAPKASHTLIPCYPPHGSASAPFSCPSQPTEPRVPTPW